MYILFGYQARYIAIGVRTGSSSGHVSRAVDTVILRTAYLYFKAPLLLLSVCLVLWRKNAGSGDSRAREAPRSGVQGAAPHSQPHTTAAITIHLFAVHCITQTSSCYSSFAPFSSHLILVSLIAFAGVFGFFFVLVLTLLEYSTSQVRKRRKGCLRARDRAFSA